MENRVNEIKEFEKSQKESLSKLSKGTTAPIHELEPLILNFINSQFLNYPEFKYLKNVEELIKRKKEFFPEIFTTGKPKTIAFNEFIYSLYLLVSERNSNYMPFQDYPLPRSETHLRKSLYDEWRKPLHASKASRSF